MAKKIPKIKFEVKHSEDAIDIFNKMVSAIPAKQLLRLLSYSLSQQIYGATLILEAPPNYKEMNQTFQILLYVQNHWDELLPKAEQHYIKIRDKVS